MTITKLKAKNQLTIPNIIVKQLRLKTDELFAIYIEGNYIKLVPVNVEPRYSANELKLIDDVVRKEKSDAKAIRPGKDFSRYIKRATK